MPDDHKAPIPPHDPVDPRPPDTRDREKTDPAGFGKVDTEGAADRALRFAKVVWVCTVVMVWAVVIAYFAFHPTADAFTETVLGIIVGGIVSCGFGFKFVYNMR